jgi:cytochrome d ubiquinol oxidase subunit I
MRTANGYSTAVSAGNGMFTLLGFMGLYTVLGILGLFLLWKEIDHGPAVAPMVPPMSSLRPATEAR